MKNEIEITDSHRQRGKCPDCGDTRVPLRHLYGYGCCLECAAISLERDSKRKDKTLSMIGGILDHNHKALVKLARELLWCQVKHGERDSFASGIDEETLAMECLIKNEEGHPRVSGLDVCPECKNLATAGDLIRLGKCVQCYIKPYVEEQVEIYTEKINTLKIGLEELFDNLVLKEIYELQSFEEHCKASGDTMSEIEQGKLQAFREVGEFLRDNFDWSQLTHD